MQEIIVYIIAAVVVGHIIRKAYKLFRRHPDDSARCAGCSGCTLKELKEKDKEKEY